jgi:hypothetical protein
MNNLTKMLNIRLCLLMTCDLFFKGKGRNLPVFMIGRQLCVVLCMFVVARFDLWQNQRILIVSIS